MPGKEWNNWKDKLVYRDVRINTDFKKRHAVLAEDEKKV